MKDPCSMNDRDLARHELIKTIMNYWATLGRPTIAEFLMLLPMQTVIEWIERETQKGGGLKPQ
jgi:hypothetical protein